MTTVFQQMLGVYRGVSVRACVCVFVCVCLCVRERALLNAFLSAHTCCNCCHYTVGLTTHSLIEQEQKRSYRLDHRSLSPPPTQHNNGHDEKHAHKLVHFNDDVSHILPKNPCADQYFGRQKSSLQSTRNRQFHFILCEITTI